MDITITQINFSSNNNKYTKFNAGKFNIKGYSKYAIISC